MSEDAVTALCLDPRDDGKILCCTYNDSSGCSVIYIIDCKVWLPLIAFDLLDLMLLHLGVGEIRHSLL